MKSTLSKVTKAIISTVVDVTRYVYRFNLEDVDSEDVELEDVELDYVGLKDVERQRIDLIRIKVNE